MKKSEVSIASSMARGQFCPAAACGGRARERSHAASILRRGGPPRAVLHHVGQENFGMGVGCELIVAGAVPPEYAQAVDLDALLL